MGSIPVHAADMLPEMSAAAFPFDRLAREPLLLADAFQMPIAMLIESPVFDEDTLLDRTVLPDRIGL